MAIYLIDPRDVHLFFGHKKILIVDLRDKSEYDMGHIETAVRIPFERLDEKYEELKKYRMLILYCHKGNQSLLAARSMNNDGFRVGSIAGGYEAYRLFLDER